MQLKTFLKRLVAQPTETRHDAYDNKDIMVFEKRHGYFPYIEFQSSPKDGKQEIYFDVLNWEVDKSKYAIKANNHPIGFIMMLQLRNDNQMQVIDEVNERLQAFYMLFKDDA